MPKFETVVIVSKGPTDELKARFSTAFANADSVVGVGVGAGAGALAGLGVSVGCGPLVVLCALVLVPVVAAAGAVSGGMADAGTDKLKKDWLESEWSKSTSRDWMIELDGLFGDVFEQRMLDAEIRDALAGKIPPDRLTDSSTAEGLLQISLFDVQFTQISNGKFTLTLKSLLIAQWNRSNRHLDNGRRLYRYTTPALSLEDWVENDGAVLNRAFDDCVASLGEQIAADIRFRNL